MTLHIGIFGMLLALLSASPATAAEQTPFDPAKVDIADVLACKIDGGHYLGFTMAIGDEDIEGSAKARGWTKIPTDSLFFATYRCPGRSACSA